MNETGGNTHDEVNEVQLAPELGHAQPLLVAGAHPLGLHKRDDGAKAEREGNHDEVVNGSDSELPSGDF